MLNRLHQIRRWAGVDRAIGFTLLNYGLSALVLPLSLFLVAHFLMPDRANAVMRYVPRLNTHS